MRLEYTDSTGHHYTMSFNEIPFVNKTCHVEILFDPRYAQYNDILFIKNGKIDWNGGEDISWISDEARDYVERVVKLMVFA